MRGTKRKVTNEDNLEVETELERNEEEALNGKVETMEEALRMNAEEILTPSPPASQQPTHIQIFKDPIIYYLHVSYNCISLTFLSKYFYVRYQHLLLQTL